jgi:hypothetical protein
MSAGSISLWFNAGGGPEGGNLHLVYVDAATGFPYEYLQTPNNVWSAKKAVNNPDETVFQAVKLVQGIGSTVMLIALDNTGRLRYTTSDDNGHWADNFTMLPNESKIDYSGFDAVWNVNAGIVVVAVGPGPVAYTQSTSDGATWSQPGWSNRPTSFSPYSFTNFDGGWTVQPWDAPWPPNFSPVAISNNGPVREEDSAPVIAGLANGVPAAGSYQEYGPPIFNLITAPLILASDVNGSLDWQWSSVPSSQTPGYTTSGPALMTNAPPYPVGVSFTDLDLDPILLLLGTDGNLYYDAPTGGLPSTWTYNQALPNPDGLSFTKAKVGGGYPINIDAGTVTLVVVAINGQDQFPYLLLYDGYNSVS